MKNQLLLALILLTVSLFSCVKKTAVDNPVPPDPATKTMKELFAWADRETGRLLAMEWAQQRNALNEIFSKVQLTPLN